MNNIHNANDHQTFKIYMLFQNISGGRGTKTRSELFCGSFLVSTTCRYVIKFDLEKSILLTNYDAPYLLIVEKQPLQAVVKLYKFVEEQ